MDVKSQSAIWDIETLQGTIGVIPYEEMELEALKRAIKALEKQVSKATKESHGKHTCPTCGRLSKMAKAILELEKMPESCMECPFYKITGICNVLSSRNHFMPVSTPSKGKRPDCPLKPIAD